MKTKDNLHNLHFSTVEFFSPKWKKKYLMQRQIHYDSKYMDMFFVVDCSSLNLYVHCEALGTKEDPWIRQLGQLDTNYLNALKQIYLAEARLNFIIDMKHDDNYGEIEYFKGIKTSEKLQELVPLD